MDIKDFIPQREPFIMVDEVLFSSGTEFKTSFLVKDTNLFLENESLSESAIIENIAQTCAAGMGFHKKKNNIPNDGLGFIGSINKLEVFTFAKIGDCIHTEVKILHQLDNILLVEGIAKVEDRILVKGQMKIVA